MNVVKLSFFLALTTALSLFAGGVNWSTDYQGALKESKETKKPIVLFFTGSDWCGWCKKLDKEAFQTEDFIGAAGKDFIFVELDYPMASTQSPAVKAQNDTLKSKYGINAYPTVILIDGNEKVLGKTGYQAGGGKAYADHLRSFVK